MDLNSVVTARIHPAIGIARVGNSPDEYFIGPEVPSPCGPPPGGYRDPQGKLKRQAARFRIYGYDAAGKVVGEITSADAQIEWKVGIANKKAGWYQFDMALDLKPEASAVQSARRNSLVQAQDRGNLMIEPSTQTICGNNQTAPPFDDGKFFGKTVYLGELRTDDAGRLVFLGGRGFAHSPFEGYTLVTYSNNPGWYDDISDGPVDATVSIKGNPNPIICDAAWVVTTPPNYAPDINGVVTMYDLVFNALAGSIFPYPTETSFTRDILPIFKRLAGMQWVNTGFFAQFGYRAPNEFLRPDLLRRLSSPGTEFQELRNQTWYMFRCPSAETFQPWQWPQIYGDALQLTPGVPISPRGALSLTATQYNHLTNWKNGNFTADYDSTRQPVLTLDGYPLQEQPDILDRAALTFCLGGPFHPGAELTWPMRVPSMYRGKFRLRRHPEGFTYPDYGDFLNQAAVLGNSGPLSASGPGDLTKWMSVPWQADTASCGQGISSDEVPYGGPFNQDPYLPTFWAPRAPNEVLAEVDYQTVMDTTKLLKDRVAAFNRRSEWTRILFTQFTPWIEQLTNMVHNFGAMGVLEPRPGIPGDPEFPDTMYVESLPALLPLAPPPIPVPGEAPRPAPMNRVLMNLRFGGRQPL
jgi:hypothetical protein